MPNLDILVDVKDMIRINRRINLEKDWIRNVSILPLKSRKLYIIITIGKV